MVTKDQRNRKNHDRAAQIACEAVASVRTVASLTGENDICHAYSDSLREPLRRAKSNDLLANLTFAISASMQYPIIALVFWYGSRLLSALKVGPLAFFVCLFVSGLPFCFIECPLRLAERDT